MYNTMNPSMGRSAEHFMYKVYGWMFAGLALTAATSYSLFAYFPQTLKTIITTPLFWVIAIAQIGLVIGLVAALKRLSYQAAALLFILYSILTGVTTSVIFLVYKMESIYTTFIITAGMFGIMALYGYFTDTDLTKYGNILLMGLIGIILGTVVNMFLGSAQFDYVLAIGGVIIFTLLTAYDMQKIKKLSYQVMGDEGTEGKLAVLGALTLYLDFINLFLQLLRLMGKKRD